MTTPPRNALICKRTLALQTRLANDISNEFDPSPPNYRDRRVNADWVQIYPGVKPRTTQPSYGYNCHGLTFAARRTQVWLSTEVQHILDEDGYVPVEMPNALPGDIAVYYSTDEPIEIEHSAIVVAQALAGDLTGPLVVSKWGPSAEYIHKYRDCPYKNVTVKFFRLGK
jgi:hypothetical protein